MTIAINIRGTGGSGKSTLVKRVMELYLHHNETHIEGRKRPISTTHWVEGDSPKHPSVLVPGHYETACGGCDTVKTIDQVYSIVNTAVDLGHDALYEGIMVMDDVTRAVALDKKLKALVTHTTVLPPKGLYVIALNTPIEECLAAIRDRRVARGDEKPLNEKNTRQRYERCLRGLARLKDAGVAVEKLDREAAFLRVRELLGV